MKNNIRVKSFAAVKDGFRSGQVVFLEKKTSGGYMVKGVGHFSYEGFEPRNNIKPLDRKSKENIESFLESAKEECEFYQKALEQIRSDYDS